MNYIQLSPRFSYLLAKRLDGIKEEGSTKLWVMRACKIFGNCRDKVFPTNYHLPKDEFRDDSKIPIDAFLDAMNYKIPYYQRLYTIDDCIKCLNEVDTINFSFDIFESIKNPLKGVVQMPKIGEKHLGSHSVLVIGYTKINEEKFFVFNNSWGTKWGDNGRGFLPFAYFEEGLVSEAFADGVIGIKPKSSKKYNLITRKKIKVDVVHNQYLPLRNSKYYLHTLDIYIKNINIGHVHISPLNESEMEIEEFYILPQYQNIGVGSILLKHIEDKTKESGYLKLIGWIPAQDIISERIDRVRQFFKRNKFILEEDEGYFRDCVYRFEKQLK